MKTSIHCGVVGFGPVGQKLCEVLLENGWNIRWVARTSGLYTPRLEQLTNLEPVWSKEASRDLDVVFIAIPSSGDGAVAERYARHFLRAGVFAVTCEKASSAFRPGKLRKYQKSFRNSATVGGNTGVLDIISRDMSGITEVVGVANTTLNFLRELIVSGVPYDTAIAEAIKRNFTESGDLQAELRDLLLKSVILFNRVANLKKPLRFQDLVPAALSNDAIKELLARNHTCVIRIGPKTKKSSTVLSTTLLICRCCRGAWQLEVHFENVLALPFIVPNGDNNVFSLTNRIGENYLVFGQGAGARPTAGRMFHDACDLLRTN